MIADVSIPLSELQQKFIDKAKESSGREISINGETRLTVSFYPTLVIDQVRIMNDPGWQTDNILSAAWPTRVP